MKFCFQLLLCVLLAVNAAYGDIFTVDDDGGYDGDV